MADLDAIVVGSGPNGLAAAIVLARAGCRVEVRESAPTAGGGLRTASLVRSDVVHDICSAVHPMAAASPFFRGEPLAEHGLRFVDPPIALAHPFDDGPPALLQRSIRDTATTLGEDAAAYSSLVAPLVDQWEPLFADALAPLHVPERPLLLVRFGVRAIRSARGLATSQFAGERARALLAGIAAHAVVPLTATGSASFGLVLAVAAHAVGWPLAHGGSRAIADAMVARLRALGGTVVTDAPVRSLAELPPVQRVLLDVTPRQLLALGGERWPARYRRALARYRYGPGVFKIDWVLSAPVPWRDPECARAGTVHLGGRLAELVAAAAAPWRGQHPERPFVLLAQPSLFDSARAPAGTHALWAYCHVPHGSTVDMTEHIERQIERFAPGFRDVVIGRHVFDTRALEAHNANLVGGDIGGGANTIGQLFFRPVARRVPYATPLPGVYLCSSSTPPGGGVHGLCGYHAAKAALDA